MRVYHFTSQEAARSILEGKRLRLSSIDNLNDPFDFQLFKRSSEKNKWAETFESMRTSLGLICFSRDYRNPVQWAHYAESHRGLCLVFEVNDKLLKRVKYFRNRKKLPIKLEGKKLWNALRIKYKDWEYEAEVRIIMEKGSPESDGYCYLNFGNDLILKQIMLGYRSDVTADSLLPFLDSGVSIAQVEPDGKEFSMSLKTDPSSI